MNLQVMIFAVDRNFALGADILKLDAILVVKIPANPMYLYLT